LDGTLLSRERTVPKRNLEAIARLKSKGGHFAVATGRSAETGAQYLTAVSPNGPCIILNGTILYDYPSKKILWNLPLSTESTKNYIKLIQESFPSTGIEVFGMDCVHVINSNDYVIKHLSRENLSGYEPRIFDGRPLCKALFMDDAEIIEKVIAFIGTFPHDDVRFVKSSANYLEMLPVNADKGRALKKAAELYGYSIENVYAIGDFYNDVELLKAAGFAAVPENSPDDLKRQADLVVCHCNDGAVADLIEYIERKTE
jgi:Cof subfamily protein (haloacid dehalogenase superfamily)